MSTKRGVGSNLKDRVQDLLRAPHFSQHIPEWHMFRPRQVINPLFSFLCSIDPLIKWRTVTAIGVVMARMADEDMESARNIMRRLMWNLNDESGGIGWGCPEAMAEIMTLQDRLADEYHAVFTSYLIPEGNLIEHPILQCGVLWGIGRMAPMRPGLLLHMTPYLLPYLESADPFQRGLAAWALIPMKLPPERRLRLEPLLEDHTPIGIYEDAQLTEIRISDLALRAMNS